MLGIESDITRIELLFGTLIIIGFILLLGRIMKE